MVDPLIFPPPRIVRAIVQSMALLLVAAVGGCQQAQLPEPVVVRPKTVAAASGEDSGALSSAARSENMAKADVLKGTEWPPLQLHDGKAEVSCGHVAVDGLEGAGTPPMSDATAGKPGDSAPRDGGEPGRADAAVAQGHDGEPDHDDAAASAVKDEPVADAAARLVDLGYAGVAYALAPCRESAQLRLRYVGKIGSDFTALMQRVSAMADRMAIDRRVLDIDSSGGRVEDAMRAGDLIAESRWTIDVADGAVCHSACSLVLAAGDDREIRGLVGIHRMIRIGSLATSRAEVSQELRNVYGQMKDYLERNGASVAVADLMMTVPNRSLRLLSGDELQAYGLSGTNAVQDDLDRIRLTRQCGDEFVKRNDAYVRAFDAQCESGDSGADIVRRCEAELRDRLQFPDDSCRMQAGTATASSTGVGGARSAPLR